MAYQFSIYLLPLILAGVISAVLAVFVARNLEKRTAPQILAILLAAVIWSVADTARLASTDPTPKLLWHNVRFLGSTIVVLGVFLHAVEYTNREGWITRRSIAALATIFIATNILVWIEGPLGLQLVHADIQLIEVNATIFAEFQYGNWFYVNAVYSYLLLIGAAVMYFIEFIHRSGTYRLQTGGLIVGTLVPWGLNGLYLADVTLVDLTAFGFTVTGVVFVAEFYKLQLLDVVPIARRTVVNYIESGYLVVDMDGRILDVNQFAADLHGRPRDAIIGSTIQDLYTDCPKIIGRFSDAVDTRDDITIQQGDDERTYDIDISPVYDDHENAIGRVVLIHDVTDQRQRQQMLYERTEALKRQNERLDQFASIVSHDLRNPIAVAKGHLQIAREEETPESFDRVTDALDRMEEITDDVLALAREEQNHLEPEHVDIGVLAEQAWTTVDTGEATLVVETTMSILADPSRLRRAFENLFRNAIEHGKADITVRIGATDTGFYVADNGPGIPEEDRDTVFTPGFSTADDGTGFGLAIVDAAAEAHGWSVSVTESTDSGARFEFAHVEIASEDNGATGGATS